MSENNTIVQASLMPFSKTFETLHVEKCKTVQEIVNKTIPFNFTDCNLVVTLNNEILPKSEWKKPLKKGEIVGLNFVPTGGGGDSKNPIVQVVAIVAVAALTYYTGGGFAAAMKAGAYFKAAGYAGLQIAGTMLINMATTALMSTPKQFGRNASLSESRTQFVEGARNKIDKYGVVPINLGVNRMFPPQAALPYTETSGNDQFARQIFTYGYGKVIVSDRKIGETSIDDFNEIETSDRLNGDLNQGTPLYTNDVFQENLNVKVTKEVGYVKQTTQTDTDECEIDLTFQGLAYFNDAGGRDNTSVELEIQYAPTGTENWSVGVGGLDVPREQIVKTNLVNQFFWADKWKHWSHSTVFLILNLGTGYVYTTRTRTLVQFGDLWPTLSNDDVVLGYVTGGYPNNPLRYIDNRQNLVGKYIESMNDFIVNANLLDSGYVFTVQGGKLKGVRGTLIVTDATSQVLRKVKRIVFPKRGQYDIRIRRLTNDSNDDRLRNDSFWTALRSISYQQPVKFSDISGTSMRIKATDQLNGVVETYNAVVSSLIKGYRPDLKAWQDDVISSNPADLFRYVLQSPAFAKRVPDSKIDIAKLEEWWVYCSELNLTYNRVIDYETSIDDVLNDICAAGVATMSKVNNVYTVIIDNERPYVKGLVTPRNSWGYQGNINYPDIPHGLRIEFRNEEKGYETDERIVFAEGYDATNATLYERLQFPSCTNADLAYWYGKRYYATALLQPETHTFNMDFENLTFNRGDRISLVNDVILVGVGQGRISKLLVDNVKKPTIVKGFVIDDVLQIPEVTNLGVRIRNNNGKDIKYHLLKPTFGDVDEFTFVDTIPFKEAPELGSLCAFVEDGKELDLIITQIKPSANQTAQITAIDYAPERFEPLGPIPPFESNITIPADFYKPYAPVLAGEIQTDESVMIRNSDGSLTSVIVIPLLNRNTNDVLPIVQCQRKGTTTWFNPTALKRDPNQLILTGLEDGITYDFKIRYQRQGGRQILSDPLFIDDIKFIGGSTPPKNVNNFRVTVTNGLALFEWEPNNDIDISHYVIRYSASTKDVSWEGSQVAMDKITSTSITNIIHKGTYLIKAYDMLGNESPEPTVIISDETGAFKNIVEELIQDPSWPGVKDNVAVFDGLLYIDDDTTTEGFYYFDPDVIDLTAVYDCSLTANLKAFVEKRDKIRDVDHIRDVKEIRNIAGKQPLEGRWGVELQMNLSDDGINFKGWTKFIASQMKFRAVKFRLRLWSENVYITPRVTTARVVVDMPDRYESGENIMIKNPNVGGVITYHNAFRNNPSVNITVQDGAVGDKIEYITKNNKGFTIKIFNDKLQSYVARSFDFIAAGYGRVVKNGTN